MILEQNMKSHFVGNLIVNKKGVLSFLAKIIWLEDNNIYVKLDKFDISFTIAIAIKNVIAIFLINE